MLMINVASAMGKPYSPCPSKDILARIESTLNQIDEINEHEGERPVFAFCWRSC